MNKQHTVLVVEDTAGLAQAIEVHLKNSGCTVHDTRSVDDAIAVMEEHGPEIDFVWLDHYLPQKNGIEFLRYLKENINHPEYAGIPVFLVSNTASPEKTQDYLALGANKYYVKAKKSLKEITEDLIATLEEES